MLTFQSGQHYLEIAALVSKRTADMVIKELTLTCVWQEKPLYTLIDLLELTVSV